MNTALRILFGLAWSAWVSAAPYVASDKSFSFAFDDKTWEIVVAPGAAGAQDVDRAMAERTVATLQRRNADEKYRARFSVVVDDPTRIKEKGATPLEAYARHALEFLKNQRFHVLSSGPKKLPKVSDGGYEIVAHQRDFGLTFRQQIFLHKSGSKTEAYLLTAATRTNKFDGYKGELDSLFDSFTFSQATTAQ